MQLATFQIVSKYLKKQRNIKKIIKGYDLY